MTLVQSLIYLFTSHYLFRTYIFTPILYLHVFLSIIAYYIWIHIKLYLIFIVSFNQGASVVQWTAGQQVERSILQQGNDSQ